MEIKEMKRLVKNILVAAVVLSCATSCYDDYTSDYDYTVAYFSSQSPMRTVIADRDMNISLGVALGGWRTIDPTAWVTFEIDDTLLESEDLTFDFELLPSKYYTLSDRNTMRVTNTTLSIADVDLYFNDEFYEDPKSMTQHYALPLRISDMSLDQTIDGKDYSIVAIKYQSTYHGTFYIMGSVTEIEGGEDENIGYVTPQGGDLAGLSTLTVETLNRTTLNIPSYGISIDTSTLPIYPGDIEVTFGENGELSVAPAAGNTYYQSGSGSYNTSAVVEGEERLVIYLNYRIKYDGITYDIAHSLVRREDPASDLRYEEWVAAQ